MCNREIDIIQYLPLFMREYLQLKLIMGAESKILSDVYLRLCEIENNQYVLTADEEGISRYEKIVGIISDSSQNLETRRYKVLTKMNMTSSFTLHSLIQRLNEICGEGNYDLKIDYDKYTIYLNVHIGQQGMIDVLYEMLYTMLPANMVFKISNSISIQDEIEMFANGSVVTKKKVTFRELSNSTTIEGQVDMFTNGFTKTKKKNIFQEMEV